MTGRSSGRGRSTSEARLPKPAKKKSGRYILYLYNDEEDSRGPEFDEFTARKIPVKGTVENHEGTKWRVAQVVLSQNKAYDLWKIYLESL
jgi:hypothetical protein